MSDLNMQFVREFFELHLFHVLTHWQHDAITRISDAASLLFVEHTNPEAHPNIDFLLHPNQVDLLHLAVVEVRAWHADRFYPSVIESSPVLGHVASDDVRQHAQSVFGTPEFTTILVISELPASPQPRQRALDLLRQLGIGHVVEFATLLQDILTRISAHGHYAPSQTLQTIRLLKRYNFVRRQQLEFPFPLEAPPSSTPPAVHAEVPPQDAAPEE